MTDTLYRSQIQPGRDSFAQTVRAEWVKFRTVRGWVIGLGVAALAILALGLGPSAQGSCGTNGPASDCTQPLGPGGEEVTDSFYFAHQPLDGNGTITVRVTSLTGQIPDFSGGGRQRRAADAQRPGALGQGRDHHQGQYRAGVGVRGDDGHRRPRGADAVRLHRRRARSGRRRFRRVAALAAAHPVRRHVHRLRLGRRRALDQGRRRHPDRAAADGAGRPVRHVPAVLAGIGGRHQRDRRPQRGDRRLRPRQPRRRLAERRVGRHRHRRRRRPGGRLARAASRTPPAGSP